MMNDNSRCRIPCRSRSMLCRGQNRPPPAPATISKTTSLCGSFEQQLFKNKLTNARMRMTDRFCINLMIGTLAILLIAITRYSITTSSSSLLFVCADVAPRSDNNSILAEDFLGDGSEITLNVTENDGSNTSAVATNNSSGPNTTSSRSTTSSASFAESIQYYRKLFYDQDIERVRREYWELTLNDIKNLTIGGTTLWGTTSNTSVTTRFFDQWKLAFQPTTTTTTKTGAFIRGRTTISDKTVSVDDAGTSTATNQTTTSSVGNNSDNDDESDELAVLQFWQGRNQQRFDGFLSWERLLQEWSDEIQDYMDQVESEEGLGYSLGNYGRPPPKPSLPSSTTSTTSTDGKVNEELPHFLPASLNDDDELLVSLDDATLTVLSRNEVTIGSVTAEEAVVKNQTSTKTRVTNKVPPSLPIPEPAKPGEPVLPHTDLSDLTKRILIVTTASMPWRTGTAVNPLLRAAYLTTPDRIDAGGTVTLMVPWLERIEDQQRVYNKVFVSQDQQTQYIRDWLKFDANMDYASIHLNIQWYTAWQNKVENSIYSMGDITALIPSTDRIDICILEEPEHLNWYRAPGESWTKKFPHVVGILHTNYFSYALDQPAALIRAPAMRLLCSWMCRAHCHRIVKLSGTLDKMAPEKELVENVHGVRGTFLDVGKNVSQRLVLSEINNQKTTKTILPNKSTDPIFGVDTEHPKMYFIGKMLWSKGLGSLMELLKYAEESAELKGLRVDMYGGGPDKDAAQTRANKLELDMKFHGPIDHSELGYTHKIFINPSTSEVLCTTSAEALAMNKFIIVPSHPSNDFFVQFPNCLPYSTKEEFVGNLYYAMTHSPQPLDDIYMYALSWEAATERLVRASSIPVHEAEQMEQLIANNEAAIEISLPPIVDNTSEEGKKTRENLAKVLQRTRVRYRQFRNRLSAEIKATRVLPKPLGDRLVAELDKRLNLNIDEILESPKLRIKLSPAELDNQLLELYDSVTKGPSGDILRILGGGGPVALQNLYMKRKADRERRRQFRMNQTKNKKSNNNNNNNNNYISSTDLLFNSVFPSFGSVMDDSNDNNDVREEGIDKRSSTSSSKSTTTSVLSTTDDSDNSTIQRRTASQWVRYSLTKNQRKLAQSIQQLSLSSTTTSTATMKDNNNGNDMESVSTTTVLLQSQQGNQQQVHEDIDNDVENDITSSSGSSSTSLHAGAGRFKTKTTCGSRISDRGVSCRYNHRDYNSYTRCSNSRSGFYYSTAGRVISKNIMMQQQLLSSSSSRHTKFSILI